MKISLNNLKDLLDIEDNSLDHTLNMIGHEVESYKQFIDPNIVIGRIETLSKHPNSDRLTYCKVNIGDDILDIVCGAKNYRQDDRVAVAKVGSIVNGIKIEEVNLRGTISRGMLCSSEELGLYVSEGIMIFNEDAPIGQEVYKYLCNNDTIYDLSITPNRSDALSHLGIARDLAAYYGKTLRSESIKNRWIESIGIDSGEKIPIQVSDTSLYRSFLIKDVKVKDSSNRLKSYLNMLGIKSINNIVDISNLVMIELGHPTHMFDADKIDFKTLTVREAKENESFVGLDGNNYDLNSSDIVVSDRSKILAIAGVIGSLDSCIDSNTKNILLEIAIFDKTRVRKTSKRLGLSTEASYRFERGIDPLDSQQILYRILDLLGIHSVYSSVREIHHVESEYKHRSITIDVKDINRFLGTKISFKSVMKILEDLKFIPYSSDSKKIVVTVPSFRLDINREVCIYEEVARIYGYEKIPSTLPKLIPKINDKKDNLFKLRDLLVSLGLNEAINYSFVPEKYGSTQILNPINSEFSHLRSSMLYGLLKSTIFNINNGVKRVELFEIGSIFDGLNEHTKLAVAISGIVEKSLWEDSRNLDIYDLKGILENILLSKGYEFNLIEKEHEYMHPYLSYNIYADDKKIGFFGEVSPILLKELGFKKRIFFFEIDIIDQKNSNIEEIIKYPSVERELSLEVSRDIKSGDMIKDICSNSLITKFNILDVYTGENISSNLKSVAFKFIIQSSKKTLSDFEIESVVNNILEIAKVKYNAKLRGF